MPRGRRSTRVAVTTSPGQGLSERVAARSGQRGRRFIIPNGRGASILFRDRGARPRARQIRLAILDGSERVRASLSSFDSYEDAERLRFKRWTPLAAVLNTDHEYASLRCSNPALKMGRLMGLKSPRNCPLIFLRYVPNSRLGGPDDELYVFAQSADRVAKERAMRRRQLKWLWARLDKLAAMNVTREEMLMKLGAARSKAPSAWRLIEVALDKDSAAPTFSLNRQKLRIARRREGRYLLRTNLTDNDPAVLWQYYVQLVAVEEAFKNLKGDLAIRPIFHHDESRIEAHIFIAFLAYALQVTLTRRLHALAPGLTARSACRRPDDRRPSCRRPTDARSCSPAIPNPNPS